MAGKKLRTKPPHHQAPLRTDHPVERSAKPIDRWLGIAGIAIGILYWILPKTSLSLVGSLALMFLLLAHPIWNFWWIEGSNARRIAALLILAVSLIAVGSLGWPTAPSLNINARVDINELRANLDAIKGELLINIHLKNYGTLPAASVVVDDTLVFIRDRMSDEEMGLLSARIARSPAARANHNELQPNEGMYYSIGTAPRIGGLKISPQALGEIAAERKRLIVLGMFHFREPDQPKGEEVVTEFCSWCTGHCTVWHRCGTNRIYKRLIQ